MRLIPVLIANIKPAPTPAAGVEHLLRLRRVERHWLFTQNMFACFQGRNRNFAVHMVGCKHINDFQLLLEQLSIIRKHLCARRAIFFARLLRAFLADVAKGSQRKPSAQFLQRGEDACCCDKAAADDAGGEKYGSLFLFLSLFI